jgi:DNA-binding response OmpR family regulator
MNTSSSTSPITIVVAEHIPELRSLLVLILHREGFHVLEASTAAEALHIVATYEEPIGLLVTGMGLSDMTGEKLGSLLADMRPGIRTLCLSAHPREHLISLGDLHPATPFLGKPFKLAEFRATVYQLLDEPFSSPLIVHEKTA